MKKIGIVLLVLVVILFGVLLLKAYQAKNSSVFDPNALPALEDGATQFDDSDLICEKLSYGMTRSDVIRILGTPAHEEDSLKQSGAPFIYGRYISYSYGDDLTLTFYDFGRGEMLLRKSFYNQSGLYLYSRPKSRLEKR